MDFSDKIKQFSKRIELIKENLATEEATKTSLIMPLFQMLEYDIFNPMEFVPEFTADVGTKKGEKVDYAIIKDDKPVILIEAKSVNDKLVNHDAQLFRYFTATEAKFAILTNGIIYKFFTDLEEKNKMDEKPFFEINLLDIDDMEINELKKFAKNNFDVDKIASIASELKYTKLIKEYLNKEMQNPDDDFVRFIISDFYSGVKTRNVVERFRPVVKKSLNRFVSDFMNDKLKTLLNESDDDNEAVEVESETVEDDNIVFADPEKGIYTTKEELEGFEIVKKVLADTINVEDISYKDVRTYFGILYKGNIRKWICRLKLDRKAKYICISDGVAHDGINYPIDSVEDIPKYTEELKKAINLYL